MLTDDLTEEQKEQVKALCDANRETMALIRRQIFSRIFKFAGYKVQFDTETEQFLLGDPDTGTEFGRFSAAEFVLGWVLEDQFKRYKERLKSEDSATRPDTSAE